MVSTLGSMIDKWANLVLLASSVPAAVLQGATLTDLGGSAPLFTDSRQIMVQCLLRHAMAKVISEGIINSIIVTNSPETNSEFLHMHDRLFARMFLSHPVKPRKRIPDISSPSNLSLITFPPLVFSLFWVMVFFFLEDATAAAVWRRHTFSAAVDLTPEMMRVIFEEIMPSLAALLPDSMEDPFRTRCLFETAFKLLCQLNKAGVGLDPDMRYRSFVSQLENVVNLNTELVKSCRPGERQRFDHVGATLCFCLLRISPRRPRPGVVPGEIRQTIVHRAQVICECALQRQALPSWSGQHRH
jgi:hypothetical protein